MNKTISEINEKIRSGNAVVVTAEEMVTVVKKSGAEEAAEKVDVVTTGTFGPMCSSGAFLNLGHPRPKMKMQKVFLNGVEAYAGLAAVDIYIGATQVAEDDPLNREKPGSFTYGGGHLLEDLVRKNKIHLEATAYGTDCYPSKYYEAEITLDDIPEAVMVNPRNAYQNYNCAVNTSEKTVYTYMGILKGNLGNANFCSAGQLSPLLNDPFFRTIGIGTRIFLGGAEGYVTWQGTQHKPGVERNSKGFPLQPGGTLMVTGNLKEMSPEWVKGVSMTGYGPSLMVGIGVPIPVLDEEIAAFCGVSDSELSCPVVDYSNDYPNSTGRVLGSVTYEELKSGTVKISDLEVPTGSLSSYYKALEIADILKKQILKGRFFLGEPQKYLPDGRGSR